MLTLKWIADYTPTRARTTPEIAHDTVTEGSIRPTWRPSFADRAPEHLLQRPVRDMDADIVLGSARPPRTPLDLAERHNEPQEIGKVGQKD
jgi:hypothetical protein